MSDSHYVLVTPAHNEEQTLGLAVAAVARQTLRPEHWVIVSDGSTDGTDAIIQKAAESHAFIRYLRREKGPGRSFSAKVQTLKAGVEVLKPLPFRFIGFMDADITLEPSFFESLLSRMSVDPRHGLGGGAIYEKAGGPWELLKAQYSMSVAGAVQVFRRECYDETGGYIPLPYGGVDMAIEAMARMKGWTVKSFTDLKVYHHHLQGRTHGGRYRALFRRGMMEYVNGYHPLFQLARLFTWLRRSPILTASLLRTTGYFWAMLTRQPRAVPPELIEFLAREQKGRLWSRLKRENG